ncbi:MAG: indole-3-glycerol phosphate synthase TrpC, partial [Eggerthellaceae bacterium]|nr:indole-3-glycerol phosphate synthase TrpC [Eggerthellaceae bacterium]
MPDILEQIAASNRERIGRQKQVEPLDLLIEKSCGLAVTDERPFRDALAKDGLSFICEVKKASPSKGVIAEEFDPIAIAKSYEQAGADAISCLTEPRWFMGSDSYIEDMTKSAGISTPILRKDFTVDEYMLYQAALIGAKAVLLIVSLLDDSELERFLELSSSLGLSALVEAHDESEVRR